MKTEVDELLDMVKTDEANLAVSFEKVDGTHTLNVFMGKTKVGQLRMANISRRDNGRPYYFYSTPKLRTGRDNSLFIELKAFSARELGNMANAKTATDKFLAQFAKRWKIG
jgi:hypothetical protein